jgi:hypothetical protein
MSIHIHLRNNTITPLFTITDELIDALASSFELFEKKTCVFIDQYGDTRLSYQHTALLLKIINGEIEAQNLLSNRTIIDLTGFLEKLVNEHTDVELIGD